MKQKVFNRNESAPKSLWNSEILFDLILEYLVNPEILRMYFSSAPSYYSVLPKKKITPEALLFPLQSFYTIAPHWGTFKNS